MPDGGRGIATTSAMGFAGLEYPTETCSDWTALDLRQLVCSISMTPGRLSLLAQVAHVPTTACSIRLRLGVTYSTVWLK